MRSKFLLFAILCLAIIFVSTTAMADDNSDGYYDTEFPGFFYHTNILPGKNPAIFPQNQCGDNLSWSYADGVLTITGFGEMWDMLFVRTFDSFDSYLAVQPWDFDTESVRSIYLPEGITSIGSCAFTNFTALETVNLPAGLLRIGVSAFEECRSLESIVIPASCARIESRAFCGCSSLTELSIPYGVTSIRGAAFESSGIISVSLPDSLLDLGLRVFANTPLLEVTIPESVTVLRYAVFEGCTELKRVSLPKTLVKIDSYAFSMCHNLSSISIPDHVTYIGEEAFSFTESLTAIELPETLTDISDGLFFESGISSVKIPNSITSIGEEAFWHCSSLIKIVVPDSVEYIGRNAFFNCGALEEVLLPQDLMILEEGTFSECWCLNSVHWPDNLKIIGASAFYNCFLFDNMPIPEGVTQIGDKAFFDDEDPDASRTIFVPASVTVFGESILRSNDELTTNIVYCYSDSPAQEWAEENEYTIMLLDDQSSAEAFIQSLPEEMSLIPGETSSLTMNAFPQISVDRVIWSSENSAVASVSGYGRITAHATGHTTITVTVGNISKTCFITVLQLATDFHMPDIFMMSGGYVLVSPDSVTPANASLNLRYSIDFTFAYWSFSNSSRFLYGKTAGEFLLTAMDKYTGMSRTATVHICDYVSSIDIEAGRNMYVGIPFEVTVQVYTDDGQQCLNQMILFESSDEEIATVNDDGVVMPLRAGEVTITARSAKIIQANSQVIKQVDNNHPASASQTFTIVSDFPALPASVKTIDDESLAGLTALGCLVIPREVESIADNAFNGSQITLIVENGSYAENWARTHNVKYIVRNSDE